jgi:ABC-type transport system substrate-binding protein
MPDGDERTDLYRRMAEMVVADAPWIFMHHPVDFSLCHEWLVDYRPHDFPYGMEKHYRLRPGPRGAGGGD